MGMLMAMTLLKQKEEAAKAAAKSAELIPDEEIPFTDPEEPAETPVRKPVNRKPATVTRRRKPAK